MLFWAAKLADFDTQLHVQDSVSGHQDQRLDHSVYCFVRLTNLQRLVTGWMENLQSNNCFLVNAAVIVYIHM